MVAHMQLRRSRTLALIAVVFACIFMLALSAWQLQRLSWKNALIAKIEQAQSLPALGTLPEGEEELKQAEYRNVVLTGRWLADKGVLHLVGRQSGGYIWLAPFQLEDSDQVVLANAGWFPANAKVESPPSGNVVIEGYVRLPHAKRLFSPGNSPKKNTWFIEDLPAMAEALHTPLLPIIIETQKLPRLRNDHLGYAITWFLLAVACGGMYIIGRKKL